jgi:hypothetical protein
MKVNSVSFFMSISRHIKFGTAEFIESHHAKVLLKAVTQLQNVYAKGGFRIVDGKFESLRPELANLGMSLNTASRDEHVPEIERRIRTVKERVRGVWNTIPFKKVPHRMTIELVMACNYWLNAFPAHNGISDTISPRALINSGRLDFAKHCKLQFGEYVQVHDEHSNNMAPRTTGALALHPTGNDQGGHYFYSLTTGKRVNRNHWTKLPMPAEVIDRVHQLARRDKVTGGLVVEGRNVVEDDDDDSDFDPNDSDDDQSINSDDESYAENVREVDANPVQYQHTDHVAGVYPTQNAQQQNAQPNPGNNQPDDYSDDDTNEDSDDDADETGVDAGVQNDEENETGAEQGASDTEPDDDGNDDDDDNVPDEEDELDSRMDQLYGPRTSGHDLRQRKARSYGHLHVTSSDRSRQSAYKAAALDSMVEDFYASAFLQHTMKAGIKRFGDRGTEAVKKELQQLHDRQVLVPMHLEQLTGLERSRALGYLMFLKEKTDGSIKGRGCADGRPQRAYIPKEDATSPTVRNELLTAKIDAYERRDVATVDLPGAFMQADMDDVVHMRLIDVMVQLLMEIDASYAKFVCTENGKQVLYAQLAKALYGTLKAARHPQSCHAVLAQTYRVSGRNWVRYKPI